MLLFSEMTLNTPAMVPPTLLPVESSEEHARSAVGQGRAACGVHADVRALDDLFEAPLWIATPPRLLPEMMLISPETDAPTV